MAYRDYYAILGIGPQANEMEIRLAYRRLARRYHPDLHPDRPDGEARLKELNEAYEVLGDPARRAAYHARYPAVRVTVDAVPRPPRARPSSAPHRPPPRQTRAYAEPPSHVDLSGASSRKRSYDTVDLRGAGRRDGDPWARSPTLSDDELLVLYLRRVLRALTGW
jgi:curved DNA-binding protein CbpA